MGDGATWNGYDEGCDLVFNYTTFYRKNLAGYLSAIEAQTGTVMSSYSAINGVGMVINSALLIGKLKDELGFDGFVISDYGEVQKVRGQGLPTDWIKFDSDYKSTCMIIAAGVDMMMLPGYDPPSLDQYLLNL